MLGNKRRNGPQQRNINKGNNSIRGGRHKKEVLGMRLFESNMYAFNTKGEILNPVGG